MKGNTDKAISISKDNNGKKETGAIQITTDDACSGFTP